MTMLFRCIRCCQKLRGKHDWWGKKVRCPCGTIMRLPKNREWLWRMLYRSKN